MNGRVSLLALDCWAARTGWQRILAPEVLCNRFHWNEFNAVVGFEILDEPMIRSVMGQMQRVLKISFLTFRASGGPVGGRIRPDGC